MLKVLYWNVWKKNALIHLALRARDEFDVIAIQEFVPDKKTNAPPCSRMNKYNLIYFNGRAALYVHKRHDPGTWKGDGGKDWCCVTIHDTRIFSVYSPPYEPNWTTPLRELGAIPPRPRSVFVGDFNQHHPLWDKYNRTSPGSDALEAFTTRRRLGLATPRGEPTWQKQGKRDGTIDLAWATRDITLVYQGEADLTGSDHIPQVITIETVADPPRPNPPTPQWHLMDSSLVKAEAAYRFRPGAAPALPTHPGGGRQVCGLDTRPAA